MEIRAYPIYYLAEAKRHLGVCTDYLVNVCGIPPDRVGHIYGASGTMRQFGRADPGVLAGLSGTELGQRLFRELRVDEEPPEPMRGGSGKSPEYWGGWALAHFQWHWRTTFRWIFERATLSALLAKYSVYHEMDISRFLEDFMEELRAVKTEPHLRAIRRAAGLSQAALARETGVNIRNIQLYEQRAQDIDRASAVTLAALARRLGCSIEDLMEGAV